MKREAIAILTLVAALSCGREAARPYEIIEGTLPPGVTIDGWTAESRGNILNFTARIHNRSEHVVSAVTLVMTFRDCEAPPSLPGSVSDEIINGEPDGFDGLPCEIIGDDKHIAFHPS